MLCWGIKRQGQICRKWLLSSSNQDKKNMQEYILVEDCGEQEMIWRHVDMYRPSMLSWARLLGCDSFIGQAMDLRNYYPLLLPHKLPGLVKFASFTYLPSQCSSWNSLQHPGILGSVIDAEQKVADQGEKLWKKLPGIKEKDRTCQLHVEVGAISVVDLV